MVRGPAAWSLEDFLGSLVTAALRSPGGSRYSRASAHAVDLPAACLPSRFNALFRQCAGVSLLRLSFAAAAGNGMFTVSSIAFASRLMLRSRLTLIRLAWIRKPWSCGEGVFHPLYRYLYLHLLFRRLHRHSSACFGAAAMLPYQSRSFGIPLLRHRTYARLLSTRDRSTGELLRTR